MSSYNVDDSGPLPHRSLLALVWSCFGVAAFFVGLRTLIRLRVGADRRLKAEDYWMFMALASLLTLYVLETIQLPSLYYMTAVIAGDVPVSEELIEDTEDYLRFEFPITILFWTVLWSVKAGFLALYSKLFRELTLYRRVWYALAIFTFLAYGGCIVTLCLSCHPINNFFKFAQCAGEQDVWASNFSVYFSTTVDVFTDLCIMAMPLRLIYNVKISMKQKLGLVAVFGLGFVMIAFSIVRAKQVLVEEYFVNLTLLMVWSTLAGAISVIVGSLPALKLLVASRAAKKGASRYGSSGGSRAKPHAGGGSMGTESKTGPVALSPLQPSSERRTPPARDGWDTESQEEMLKPEGGHYVVVQHDVTVSYRERDRPLPTYQPRLPISGMGEAF